MGRNFDLNVFHEVVQHQSMFHIKVKEQTGINLLCELRPNISDDDA
jgi:hypothetical protein